MNYSRQRILFFVTLFWVVTISCKTITRLSPFPTAIPTMTPKMAESRVDGMRLVFVEEGPFMMGSFGGEPNESPAHTVYLDSYWIDQTEVTNKMYRRCMLDGACATPFADGFIAPKDHYTDPARVNFPVTFVSWENAKAYCEWAGRRLPTEAEWEKAARGLDGRKYPWGNEEPTQELVNFNNDHGGLTKVGSFPLGASPYGALDMAGNVWEVVLDWYEEDYYYRAESINPRGPISGEYSIQRGGAYFSDAYHIRVTFRERTGPTYNRSNDIGFRCASDVKTVEVITFNQLMGFWFSLSSQPGN